MLIAGDEFGPLGGLPGSDSFLLVPEASRATAISVGAEPSGTPAEVISLGGGPELFVRVLADQLERRRRRDVPGARRRPALDARRRRSRPAAGACARIAAHARRWSSRHPRRAALRPPGASTRRPALGRLRRRGLRTPSLLRARIGRGSRTPHRSARGSAGSSILRPGCCARTATSPRFASPRSRGPAPSCSALRRQPRVVRASAAAYARRAGRGGRCATDDAVTAFERLGAYDARSGASREAALADAAQAGFERLLARAPGGLGEPVAGGRRRHRRRPRAAAGDSFRALPSDGVGRRSRTRRPSVRAVSAVPPTAATSSGTATSSCCPSWPPRTQRARGRCSSTECVACPPHARRRAPSAGPAPASPGSPRRAAAT